MSTEDNSLSKFEEIYENYREMVFDTAMMFCDNDYHTAQEITQEVFTSCFAQKIYLQKDWKKVAWLKLAVRNCYIDRWRKDQFEELRRDVTKTDSSRIFESMDDMYIHDEEVRRRVQVAHSVMDGLFHKNKRWHDYLFLYYFFEMREKDIARRTANTENAVKNVMKRAKAWARKHYDIDEDT